MKNLGQNAVNSFIASLFIYLLCIGFVQAQDDCLTLDPNGIEMKRINSKWFINCTTTGRTLLTTTNFGDARKVRDIIKYYGFNRSCYVGRPDPEFQYWLIDDSAPEGRFRGEKCHRIDVSKLEIIKGPSGLATITDGASLLFAFDSGFQAARALNIIKNYGFTHTCFVLGTDFSYLRK